MKPLDPLRALRVLNAHGVRFIVAGGVASFMQGGPAPTIELEICYDDEPGNYERLAAALRELQATARGASSAAFNTDAGPMTCLKDGYAGLVRNAVEMAFDDVHAFFASIGDLRLMASRNS